MKLRFTIRDLLWLAALVAVCVAWWLDRSHLLDLNDKLAYPEGHDLFRNIGIATPEAKESEPTETGTPK